MCKNKKEKRTHMFGKGARLDDAFANLANDGQKVLSTGMLTDYVNVLAL